MSYNLFIISTIILKAKFFNITFWTGGIWIVLGSLAFLMALILLIAAITSKPDYSKEVLHYFNKDFLTEASQYNKISLTLSIIRKLLTWIIIIVIIFATWKYFSQNPKISVLLAAGYIALFLIILQLLLMPFDYYRGFVIEHKFGLSNQVFSSWLVDCLKSKAISFLINLAVLTVIYTLMTYIPKYWWIIAGAAFIVFLIIGIFISPLIIDPLFYKFKPLEDEEMRLAIEDMANEAGIKVDEILIADASRRTNKINAYFTGIGATKRIVVFDNLLEKFNRKESLTVIAHEIGHWKYLHIVKSFIIGAISGLLLIFFSKILAGKIGMTGDIRFILIIFLLFSIVMFISLPVQNIISRSFEKQADEVAIKLTDDPQTQISLMKKIAVSNLSSVNPSLIIKYIIYSHPPIIERIEGASNY